MPAFWYFAGLGICLVGLALLFNGFPDWFQINITKNYQGPHNEGMNSGQTRSD